MKKSKIIASITALVFVSNLTMGLSTSSVNTNEKRSSASVPKLAADAAYKVSVGFNDASTVAESTTVTSTDTSTTTTVTSTTTSTETTTTAVTTTAPVIPKITAGDVSVETVSVSCLKVLWQAEEGREYTVYWETEAPFAENIQVAFKESGVAYLTGLRENSEYKVYVEPVLKEGENAEIIRRAAVGHTEAVEVVQEFGREEGRTGCFCGERASGLTAMPSSGAIYGSFADTITDTGIRRFDNGDYCCAMGTHYGYCNDRFLVELDNGIQFTVRICDSKGCGDVQDENGYGLYHYFGADHSGKCVIEFIYDDYSIPSVIWTYGSWGITNWNGLNLCSDIASIKKLSS